MKFGNTLYQRSIPEWAIHNVDYDEIKQLIKHRTSHISSQTRAISIPGQSDETSGFAELDKELFHELALQHDRITQFVRMKYGEVKARMKHLLAVIERRALAFDRMEGKVRRQQISVPEQEAKLQSQISDLGQRVFVVGGEIQALIRYVGAQRTAFAKLVKKHKKWSGSSELGRRFQNDLLDRGANEEMRSFVHYDLRALLSVWTEVQTAFDEDLAWRIGFGESRTQSERQLEGLEPFQSRASTKHALSSSEELHATCEGRVDTEFDASFATVPLGEKAGLATYWIHNQDVFELQVFLLQHMSSLAKSTSRSRPTSSGSGSSLHDVPRRPSNDTDLEPKTLTGLIACDHLENLSRQHSGATIQDVETQFGQCPGKAQVNIRYNGQDAATVAVCKTRADEDSSIVLRNRSCKIIVPRKCLRLFFSDEYEADDPASQSSAPPKSDTIGRFLDIQRWLANHAEVKPLVHLRSRRARFVGRINTKVRGMWATLDRDISMSRSSIHDLRSLKITSDGNPKVFPHAVLELRWEGQDVPDFIQRLDASHLTERVPGFSIVIHAISDLYYPLDMAKPFWIAALERDIRKIPSHESIARRNRSRQSTIGDVNDPRFTSPPLSKAPTSDFSLGPAVESPATSTPYASEDATRKKPKVRKVRKARQTDPGIAPRYWNEFDDGRSEPGNDAYTILVDPNAAGPASELFSWLKTTARSSGHAVVAWLRPFRATTSKKLAPLLPVQQPLLRGLSTPPSPSSIMSSDTDTAQTSSRTKPQRTYSTFQTALPSRTSASAHTQGRVTVTPALERRRARERTRMHFTLGVISMAFLASLAFLAMAAALEVTRRHRYARAADVGSIAGMILSLLTAAIGMLIGIVAGQRKWIQGSVILGAGLVVLGNMILILLMVGG